MPVLNFYVAKLTVLLYNLPTRIHNKKNDCQVSLVVQ